MSAPNTPSNLIQIEQEERHECHGNLAPPNLSGRVLNFHRRCTHLLQFKEEFGHCKVPQKYAANPSLANWCTRMRNSYSRMQRGLKSDCKLSPDMIERLEEIGFRWQINRRPHHATSIFIRKRKAIADEDSTPKRKKGENNNLAQSQSQPQSVNTLTTGAPASSDAENMTVTVGSTDSATGGGGFALTSSSASNGAGGNIGITEGASDRAAGELLVTAAGSSTAGAGSKASPIGGRFSFANGDGGATEDFGGDSTSQDGGNITVKACSGSTNGGAMTIPGCIGSTGLVGIVSIQSGLPRNRNDDKSVEMFQKRCRELEGFKEEFGHCSVPRKYAANPSLGNWCNDKRKSYNKIRKGLKPDRKLSQDMIERLEEIGFRWRAKGKLQKRKSIAGEGSIPNSEDPVQEHGLECDAEQCSHDSIEGSKDSEFQNLDDDETFKKHCRALIEFEEDFGHCDVPYNYTDNPTLAKWCEFMTIAYKRIQKGIKTKHLSQDRIEQLEDIGFEWKTFTLSDALFEKRCVELIEFKEDFGHCDVPSNYIDNPSLGRWCSHKRTSYSIIQGGVNTDTSLPQAWIDRLEEIGFKWQIAEYDETFDNHCRELQEFKEVFGHCDVPRNYPDNRLLSKWCEQMKNSYSKIQKGTKATHNLSEDKIKCLERIGFHLQAYDEVYDERCIELEAFKEEFGYCNVPDEYSNNPALGTCKSYNTSGIQMGMKAANNTFPEGRIERLEKIGFRLQDFDHDVIFDNHCRDLIAFKEEFGHCNVPIIYQDNFSLGHWCSSVRTHYNRFQNGMEAIHKFKKDWIELLEGLGFQWQVVVTDETLVK